MGVYGVWMLVAAGAGLIFLCLACKAASQKAISYIVFIPLCFTAAWICQALEPNGKPMQLKDGIYEVRIVSLPNADKREFGVLVLKEEGKTPFKKLLYYAIPVEFFGHMVEKLQLCREETIEIKNEQMVIIKQK